MEMELKLLIDPEARPIIEQHPLFSDVPSRTEATTTTYYDTQDLALFTLGATFRVRRSGKSFVQTVKLDRPEDRLGCRGEWEWKLRTVDPDYDKLGDLPEELALMSGVAHRLAPVFETKIERTAWLLTLDDRSTVEVVIDQGVITAGSKSLDVSELEIELKQGSAAALFNLAIDLTERARLRYEARSKSSRGYALAFDHLPERTPASSPDLDPHISIGDAFPRLVHTALREFAAEMPLAAVGDIEGVHRMRAAIRKLRSILVLFDPHLDRRAARRFNASLRSLGTVLGRRRDWDVFLTETLPRVEITQHGSGTDVLRARAEQRCAEAQAAIVDTLQAHAPTGLILGIGTWSTDLQWLHGTDPSTHFIKLVPALLDDLNHKVRKRARKLDIDDAEELHALRKSLKKLRYSIDYAGSLFDRKTVDRYSHAIKTVLGLLGEINDAAVAESRVDELVSSETPDLAPAAAHLIEQVEHRGGKARARLARKLQKLHEMDIFWH